MKRMMIMMTTTVKKLLTVLALIIGITTLSFANNYVEDMDGFDWLQSDWNARIAYVQGFYTAFSSLAERAVYEAGGAEQMTDEDFDFIDEYFYIGITVEDMVQRITDFYSDYNNRKYPIYIVLITFAGKDYWSVPAETDSYRDGSS